MKVICGIAIILSLFGFINCAITVCDLKNVNVNGIEKYTCILYNAYYLEGELEIKADHIGKTNNDVLRTEIAGIAAEPIIQRIINKFPNLEELIIENEAIKQFTINSLTLNQTAELKLKTLKINRGSFDIPARAFFACKNLETLDLSKNEITLIDSTAPQGLINLKTLILDDNQLSSLPEVRLNKLEVLSLARNKLTSLPIGDVMSTLKKYDLSWNSISNINEIYFNLFTVLEELYLQGNQISTLSPETFGVNLKVLNVASNNLQNFEFIKKLTKLENLTIADQNPKIKWFNAAMLDANTELKIFNASHNEIMELQSSLFAKNSEKITHLDMRGNRIERIELGFRDYLKNLDVALLSCNKCINNDFTTRPTETDFQVCKSSSIIISTALVFAAILSVKLF